LVMMVGVNRLFTERNNEQRHNLQIMLPGDT